MAGVLVSGAFLARYGGDLYRAIAEAGGGLEPIALPADPDARLADGACEGIAAAYYSLDVLTGPARSFFSALHRAPRLDWVQLRPAGADHPAFGRLLERGVRLTNSAGATAEPIAQSAVAGLLALARGFPAYAEAQRRREWAQSEEDGRPDLIGQTLVIYGLGAIGSAVARIARAIGLHVVGVRRSPARPDDPVDELRRPGELAALLPRADWLAIACALTPQTRGLFGAEALAALPRGARLINVARGPIVDERALAAALRSGRLGGAYLDVFEEEPLPPESPLWDMPRVIVTPHDSGGAQGNDRRAADIFLGNLVRWRRGEPLHNELREAGGVALGAPPAAGAP